MCKPLITSLMFLLISYSTYAAQVVPPTSILTQKFSPLFNTTTLKAEGFTNVKDFIRKMTPTTTSAYDPSPIALSPSGRWLVQGSRPTNDSTLKIWDIQKGELLYILGSSEPVAYQRITFSPDERYLIASNTQGYMGAVDIWDWKSAKLINHIKDASLPEKGAFDKDGYLYVYISNDYTDQKNWIKIDLNTLKQTPCKNSGACNFNTLTPLKSPLKLEFITTKINSETHYANQIISPHNKNKYIFDVNSLGSWYLLNTTTGELKHNWPTLKKSPVKPYHYTFDKNTIIIRSPKKTANNFHLPKTNIKSLQGLLSPINEGEKENNISPYNEDIFLSHNGKWLITNNSVTNQEGILVLWDILKSIPHKLLQSKLQWAPNVALFSPDDRYLVIRHGRTQGNYAPCVECGSVTDVWDLEQNKYKFSIPHSDMELTRGALLTHGDLYIVTDQQTVQHWNIQKEQFVNTLRSPQKNQTIFAVTNYQNLLAIGVDETKQNASNEFISATGTIEIWDTNTRKLINKFTVLDKPIEGGLEFNMVFVNDHEMAVATRLGDISIWNLNNGKKARVIIPAKRTFQPTYHLSSPSNNTLVSSSDFVQKWDTKTGKLLLTFNACQPDMPGLPNSRYRDLKEYHGRGKALIQNNTLITLYNCPQGNRTKLWDANTGDLKALFGNGTSFDDWFWLNNKEQLKITKPIKLNLE